MERQSKGRAVLGFFITLIMVFLLLAGGILIGLKTTVLKGNDVVDILKNANAFGMMSEMLTSELSSMMGDEPMVEGAISTIFSEELLSNVALDMTEAITSGEEVDLTSVTDECMNTIQNTSEQMIDQMFDEVAQNGEISVEALAQSEILQSFGQQFGVDITPMVEEYVDSTYGDVTIKVDDVDLEAMKAETKAALQEDMMPMLEEAVDTYIVGVNQAVNQELQSINEVYDIAGMIQIIEQMIGLVQITIIVASVILVILIIVEVLLVYRQAMNRGMRNIGLAAIFSGLMIAIVGAITTIAKDFLTGMVGIAGINQDNLLQIIMEFIEANLQTVGMRFLLIAIVYLVVAVICLILSSVIKNLQKDGISR